MDYVSFDLSELDTFIKKMEKAGKGDFKKQVLLFLESIGFEFLRILQDEIVRREVTDTRLLLTSFEKGDTNNVWNLTKNNLTLEIGTVLEYAKYVNDGHWTCKTGEKMRFVPGDVVLDGAGKVIEFHYRSGAEGGIMLKQKWVEGKHYWEAGLRILDAMYPTMLENALQQWIDSYFGA